MERILKIDVSENNAFFLWGARKTGKTTDSTFRDFLPLVKNFRKQN